MQLAEFNGDNYLICVEKTKDLGLAYDDSPFLDTDFALRLFAKS
jgi:hypothetical protein